MDQFSNRTFDEIELGASESITHQLTSTEVEGLSLVTGDVESFHLDLDGTAANGGPSAPGSAAIALISGIFNRRLPGPGSAIVGTRFAYRGRMHVGDTVTASVKAVAKDATRGQIDFECKVVHESDAMLVEGERPDVTVLPQGDLQLPTTWRRLDARQGRFGHRVSRSG